MAAINQEEVLKIAKLSGIQMTDSDITVFTDQIQKVLSFIDQLQLVAVTKTIDSVSARNVLRDDTVSVLPAQSPLAQAPDTQEGYFVVPKMLDEK